MPISCKVLGKVKSDDKYKALSTVDGKVPINIDSRKAHWAR